MRPRRVPAAKVGRAPRIVYGGIAPRVPADKVADLLRLPGVTAVQRDTLRQPRTDAVSSFIGATGPSTRRSPTTAWRPRRLGGTAAVHVR